MGGFWFEFVSLGLLVWRGKGFLIFFRFPIIKFRIITFDFLNRLHWISESICETFRFLSSLVFQSTLKSRAMLATQRKESIISYRKKSVILFIRWQHLISKLQLDTLLVHHGAQFFPIFANSTRRSIEKRGGLFFCPIVFDFLDVLPRMKRTLCAIRTKETAKERGI